MGFDQFVTTYRKDYLWPYVKTIGLKPPPQHLFTPNGKLRKACPCQCKKVLTPTSEQIQQLGPPAADQEEWSRLGPMGPLLDPKLYPAKITTPSSEVGRYAQPNVFLDKLQQKYPFIYECLKTAPPDDLLSRINKERLRSTYQVDYGKMREYPSGPYDELLRAAGVAGLQPSADPARLPGDPYRPLQKTTFDVRIKSKPCAQIARGSEKARDCVGTCSGPLAIMTAGASEYQDAISRLGTFIIMDRIHDRDSKKDRERSTVPCPEKKSRVRANLRPIAFRPGLISNQSAREMKEQRRRKRAGISDWNPFEAEPHLKCDKLIEQWGRMVYRDILHAHSPKSSGTMRKC